VSDTFVGIQLMIGGELATGAVDRATPLYSVDSRRIRTMMSHAHRRQSSETAGPFSSHPQPRVAAASERHGIAFRAHGIDAGAFPSEARSAERHRRPAQNIAGQKPIGSTRGC
jgi:hypothetical protein